MSKYHKILNTTFMRLKITSVFTLLGRQEHLKLYMALKQKKFGDPCAKLTQVVKHNKKIKITYHLKKSTSVIIYNCTTCLLTETPVYYNQRFFLNFRKKMI